MVWSFAVNQSEDPTTLLLLMIEILHDLKDRKHGKYGIFLIMGNAGFIPATVGYSGSVGFRVCGLLGES